MADLLTREYADTSPPEAPRNPNRYPCVIGATPSPSEHAGRHEKPAQGNRHGLRDDRMVVMNAHETFELPIRSSTAAICQQIGLPKRAQ
jgi:hypothetical protein